MGHIIAGVVFIIGGLSGALVLKGTGSSGALVVVGIGLVIWGILQGNSSEEKAKGDRRLNSKNVRPRNMRSRQKQVVDEVETPAVREKVRSKPKRSDIVRPRRTRKF